jgi:hypothetical protein
MLSYETPLPAITPRPPFWIKLPVLAGNAIQFGGVLAGILLIFFAAAINNAGALSASIAVAGTVIVAFCSHSIGHWLAGSLGGLRFAYIGVRGTDHPESYPQVLRQILSRVPMFTVVSTRQSRAGAGRQALAAYFAAGQTTAFFGWLGAAFLSLALGVPGAHAILIVILCWVAGTLVVAVVNPKGDYAKAWRALHAGA